MSNLKISDVQSISPDDVEILWGNVPVREPIDIPPPEDEVTASKGESSSLTSSFSCNDSNINLETGDCVLGNVEEEGDCHMKITNDSVEPECCMEESMSSLKITNVRSLSSNAVTCENVQDFTEQKALVFLGEEDVENIYELVVVGDGSGSTQWLSSSHIPQQLILIPNDSEEIQAEKENLPYSNLEGLVQSGNFILCELHVSQDTEDHDGSYGEERVKEDGEKASYSKEGTEDASFLDSAIDQNCIDVVTSSDINVNENYSDESVGNAASGTHDSTPPHCESEFENASNDVKETSVGDLDIDDSMGLLHYLREFKNPSINMNKEHSEEGSSGSDVEDIIEISHAQHVWQSEAEKTVDMQIGKSDKLLKDIEDWVTEIAVSRSVVKKVGADVQDLLEKILQHPLLKKIYEPSGN